jgi:hypothetical protein
VMMVAFAVIGFGAFLALSWLLAWLPEWFSRGAPVAVEPPVVERDADVPARAPVTAASGRPRLGL